MSINNRFGIDENRVKRFGKNYASIDFDANEKLTNDQFMTKSDYMPVGKIVIGRSEIPMTIKELEKLEETCREARSSLQQRYRLGLMW